MGRRGLSMGRYWLMAGALVVVVGVALAVTGGGGSGSSGEAAGPWSLGGVTVEFDGTTRDTSHAATTVTPDGDGLAPAWRQFQMPGVPPTIDKGHVALFVPLEPTCGARDIEDVRVVDVSPVRQAVEVVASPGCVPEVSDQVAPALPPLGARRSLVVLQVPWASEHVPDPRVTSQP